METVVTVVIVWIIVSVPAALFVGYLIRRGTSPTPPVQAKPAPKPEEVPDEVQVAR